MSENERFYLDEKTSRNRLKSVPAKKRILTKNRGLVYGLQTKSQ